VTLSVRNWFRLSLPYSLLIRKFIQRKEGKYFTIHAAKCNSTVNSTSRCTITDISANGLEKKAVQSPKYIV
jgi:hypothetical protein